MHGERRVLFSCTRPRGRGWFMYVKRRAQEFRQGGGTGNESVETRSSTPRRSKQSVIDAPYSVSFTATQSGDVIVQLHPHSVGVAGARCPP